jgi:hypothetical protein
MKKVPTLVMSPPRVAEMLDAGYRDTVTYISVTPEVAAKFWTGTQEIRAAVDEAVAWDDRTLLVSLIASERPLNDRARKLLFDLFIGRAARGTPDKVDIAAYLVRQKMKILGRKAGYKQRPRVIKEAAGWVGIRRIGELNNKVQAKPMRWNRHQTTIIKSFAALVDRDQPPSRKVRVWLADFARTAPLRIKRLKGGQGRIPAYLAKTLFHPVADQK